MHCRGGSALPNDRVIIAGGGIGGLALGLTLHQIGVPFTILEATAEMKPLGVGINLQPNAVRELFDLGITASDLDEVGVPAREWALVGLNGKEVFAEPRGLEAGYKWPQYAVHRGRLHMLLYARLVAQAGDDAVRLGARVSGFRTAGDQVIAQVVAAGGRRTEERGRLLVGADGIHSAIRAQMFPDQPPIHWGGAVMWRGTVRAKPMRTSSSFIGLGTHTKRMIIYPISYPDTAGKALINWIAEVTMDNAGEWTNDSWFREVKIADFVHHFDAFRYDWLDVPAMLRRADCAYENPMIDRDPIPTWVDGPVALIGDAAHAMYPTGSNGASQAIVDGRVLGAKLIENGIGDAALAAYDAQLCAPISQVVLRNRGAGPFGMLNILDERCGGVFENIEDVMPAGERRDFMAGYKSAAGFAVGELNAAPPTIQQNARVPM